MWNPFPDQTKSDHHNMNALQGKGNNLSSQSFALLTLRLVYSCFCLKFCQCFFLFYLSSFAGLEDVCHWQPASTKVKVRECQNHFLYHCHHYHHHHHYHFYHHHCRQYSTLHKLPPKKYQEVSSWTRPCVESASESVDFQTQSCKATFLLLLILIILKWMVSKCDLLYCSWFKDVVSLNDHQLLPGQLLKVLL